MRMPRYTLIALSLLALSCSQNQRTESSLVETSPIQSPSSLSGTWVGTYHSGPVGAAKVTLTFSVQGASYTGTFKTSTRAGGTTAGSVGNGSFSGTAKQTTPNCPGSYLMRGSWVDNFLWWTFNGCDCLGLEDGGGSAVRTN